MKEICDGCTRLIGLGYVLEENRPDDAARTPYTSDFSKRQIPVIFFRCRSHDGIALRISDDFGSLEGGLKLRYSFYVFGKIGLSKADIGIDLPAGDPFLTK